VDLFKAILIETRNICNRHCWFCKFGQERQDPDIEEIEWATIRQILANLKDLDYNGRISWHGINEPLMDPRIFDIVVETRAACPESFISLVTNGDLLTQHAYDRLKTSVDVVGVSVYDDKVFDKVSPLADGQMKVIDMRRAAAGRLENRGGTVLHEAESFREHQRLFADRTCARPSFMLPVKPSGKVALCCADMYADVVMGNVHEQRLEDIWYGEAFTTYRRVLAREGRRNLKLCQGCSYNGDAGRIFYPLPETVTHPKVQVGAITVPRGTA
jgi:radical SAM protein with 4Fe4S-binding SPASM domain